jgi:Phospholipase_D-nuclease N-terminal/Short C-terminal domain
MWFAADYPFLDVFWTMIIFFCWVIWIWMMIVILTDIFRRHDIGGWHKAAWIVFLIVLPFLGVLVYLIAQSGAMAERRAKEVQDAQSQFDSYVQQVASEKGGGSAAEIEKAKGLLDSGTITQAEFDALKTKALA